MKQRGFVIYIYLIVLAFVGAAGFGVVHKYNSAIEGRKDAEKERDSAIVSRNSYKAEGDRLKGDINARDVLLDQKNRENDALSRGLVLAKQAMATLAAANAAARSYLGSPVDDAVRMQRRLNAGCSTDLNVPCTPRGGGPDAAAAPGRPNQRGPDQRERQGAGGAG